MAAGHHSRIELAKDQLEDALSLFLRQSRYAAAITLAGAAEEIFGRALQHQGRQAVLDWKFNEINSVQVLFDGKGIERKTFVEEESRVRNALKHLASGDGETFVADLEEAACWMLVRACDNASRLEVEIESSAEFNDWFYTNIIGI